MNFGVKGKPEGKQIQGSNVPHILDNKHVTITSHTDYNIRQDYAAKARGITWLSNEILTLYALVTSNSIKSFFSS